MSLTVGVLALQGGFAEHLDLLRRAATTLELAADIVFFSFIEVRTPEQLATCDALIIPGGESTTISFVAAQSGLLEPLRDFVKYVSIARTIILKLIMLTDISIEYRRSRSGELAPA